MKHRLRLTYTLFYMLVTLGLFACDPDKPPVPTATPQPTATVTPTLAFSPTVTRTSTQTPTRTATSTPTSTPTETPQPTIISIPTMQATLVVTGGVNTNRQQYDAALAKWHALSVQEYEMRVRYDGAGPFIGTWDMRVSGSNVEILGYGRDDTGQATPPMPAQGVEFLTIEQRFAYLEDRLSKTEAGKLTEMDQLQNMLVTYDQTYGYPASIELKSKPTTRLGGIDSTVKVESLKIIRRKLLGTPQAVVVSPIATTTLPRPSPSVSPQSTGSPHP